MVLQVKFLGATSDSLNERHLKMEEVKGNPRLICTPQLEDMPVELIHIIQSLLPAEEATRTSVLSKLWLHAWSTMPTLKFRQPVNLLSEKQEINFMEWINRTLTRYFRDNLSIKTIYADFCIQSQKSAFLAKKWISRVAPKSHLNEIYLTVLVKIDSFTLPDDIFSGENLKTISVKVDGRMINSAWIRSNPVEMSSNLVIKCVSLRVLELINVHITEKGLENLFSTCTLLKKISLLLPEGLKTIRVKNLGYLQELKIVSRSEKPDFLEIYNVPNLTLFSYNISFAIRRDPLSLNTDLLTSVRELFLGNIMIMNNAFFNIINSKFPFLETLTLKRVRYTQEILDITCDSLKRLKICMSGSKQIGIQLYAPKILFFGYTGVVMPSFLFPTVTPSKTELNLKFENRIDLSLFLEMREVLNSSSRFKIKISIYNFDFVVPLKIDIDDMRRRVSFPATNVERISFVFLDEELWNPSTFFDAFFTICHPNYVKVFQARVGYFLWIWKLVLKGMMEMKTRKEYWQELKDVEIKNPVSRKWESLTSSWIGSVDRLDCVNWHTIKFKLTWCSR